MGVLPSEELVVIHPADPTVITVNCPDKRGLGCDLTRIIFEFGLSLVRGDVQTDGRWCLLVFWAVPRITTAKPIQWGLLRKRMIAACPPENQVFVPVDPDFVTSPLKLFLLQVYSADRAGLLHDMSRILWELELTVHKVKASTCPDGKVIDFFIISDNKLLLPSRERTLEVCERIKNLMGGLHSKCELKEAGPEYGGLMCTPALNLPPSVSELLSSGVNSQQNGDTPRVTIDDLLSPAHTLLQISCRDRKGLLYDCLRVLKDFNYQVAYGRLSMSTIDKGRGEIDLFITQADGRKLVDPEKQKALCERVVRDVANPLWVTVLPRGPDSELFVATPIELSGKGRPRVLYDVTLALKMLDVCIFQADIGRHAIGDMQWEIYRVLLIDSGDFSQRMHELIGERVRNVLMG
ncbi:hypothetical protein SELMODRAFT_173843 [Selaginella moellendorffii]|uniref:ACT domain-containing protein n=1 Tax=Selaginella moellendorffii TaxID=88036 RepID=D8RSG1_SELML|nr:ACT domain-containing protein ACR9 [Selaginella moellendorffii]XP_024534762.1 ACT domain-containing protein ACR9 [Selaginella moellendorffii]EFJ25064.1 hypothetical protein SELMODRAFT_173843 [Selaginella moellendorffii]|eukprot:XP_002974109.1 ACT domain-containing protein ACR9 [Selaginella moellendorffii]